MENINYTGLWIGLYILGLLITMVIWILGAANNSFKQMSPRKIFWLHVFWFGFWMWWVLEGLWLGVQMLWYNEGIDELERIKRHRENRHKEKRGK